MNSRRYSYACAFAQLRVNLESENKNVRSQKEHFGALPANIFCTIRQTEAILSLEVLQGLWGWQGPQRNVGSTHFFGQSLVSRHWIEIRSLQT